MLSRNSRSFRDLVVLVVLALLTLAASLWFDPFSQAVAWVYRHDNWKLDELFTLSITLTLGLAWYSWRRWNEMAEEKRERVKAEEERQALTRRLYDALAELRTLKGLLRICESCKRVSDETGYWIPLEAYVESNSKARFFQGICPDCARRIYRGRELDESTRNLQ
jgi:hypothetical protein